MLTKQKPLPVIKGHFKIHTKLGRPDKRRRDLDNVGAKAILDLFKTWGIIEDDSLCDKIVMEWVDDVTGCQVEIEQ